MAQSNVLFRTINTILPFADFLYLLQLEEYYTGNYFRDLPRFFFRRNVQKRGALVVTKQIIIIFLITLGLMIIPLGSACFLGLISGLSLGLLGLAGIILIPIFIGIANLLFSPFSRQLHKVVRRKAAHYFSDRGKQTKVIAIAGSYGKTTTKTIIYQLAKYTLKTQLVPGNINTPTGIAQWLMKNFDPSSELLIVEMDAYEEKEIAAACSITPPDISLLLNIGDQHLQRFPSEKTQTRALGEIFAHAKPDAVKITNAETARKFGAEKHPSLVIIEEADFPFPSATIHELNPSLSDTVLEDLQFALKVAELLNVPRRFIEDTIRNLELPDRRQKITTLFGLQGIDDSYNISFSTALAGVKAARKASDKVRKKLVVITAGIPELSKKNKDKNKEYGSFLEKQADSTIILKSTFSKEIARGFSGEQKYRFTENLSAAAKELQAKYSEGEWFLLLQPELTDLYY